MVDPVYGFVTPENLALLVDLYELTMADSYLRRGKNQEVVFDLFVRDMPTCRNFYVAAGLEQILYYLSHLRFSKEAIDYLKSLKLFSEEFLEFLRNFRFTGRVYAVKEGEIFFAHEPVIRIEAPRIEAQIVETFLLNTFNFQSNVASKAARIIIAAKGKGCVDFSPRRDHGSDAALKVARASYIAGFLGTSCVVAGMVYGIPVFGTMAHSYIMSFPSELEAFRAFVEDFPNNSVLLIDTYSVISGAKNAVVVAKEMEEKGLKLRGVRIDSGDLSGEARIVRKLLDAEGLSYVKIFLSGDLNEYKIKRLVDEEVPCDFFGVGTEMGVSKDSPALGGVYKLAQDETGPRIKLSKEKTTLPGKKQVYRVFRSGLMEKDVIALEDEKVDGEPLLMKVMEKGEICTDLPSLNQIREYFSQRLSSLPESLKEIEAHHDYPVELTPNLKALIEELKAKFLRDS